MLKKSMKLIFFGLLIFILCINISVNASTIVIEEDGDESENSGVYAIKYCQYMIRINEDNNIGYLERNINGNSVVLGTCEVIIIDVLNPEGYILCNDDNNSLGTITILINSNNEENGTIVNLNGEISTIITINEEVKICD